MGVFITLTKKVKFIDKTKILFFIEEKGIKYEANVFYKILLDKNNQIIVFSDLAIFYKGEQYIPNLKSPFYRKAGWRIKKETLMPTDYIYLDNNNYLWFCYDAGEWGGDVCFFDLKNKKFIYDIEDNNGLDFKYNFFIGSGIKGITSKDEAIYISSSKMHFSIYGDISKIEKKEENYEICENMDVLTKTPLDALRKRYKNDNEDQLIKRQKSFIEEYLGPIEINPFNNSVYYYSNLGFFKLNEFENCNFSKEFLFKPWIYWTAGLPDAVGYQMNVSKFEFISENEMVFLTTNNGIGYFNGKEVVYFK